MEETFVSVITTVINGQDVDYLRQVRFEKQACSEVIVVPVVSPE